MLMLQMTIPKQHCICSGFVDNLLLALEVLVLDLLELALTDSGSSEGTDRRQQLLTNHTVYIRSRLLNHRHFGISDNGGSKRRKRLRLSFGTLSKGDRTRRSFGRSGILPKRVIPVDNIFT